MAIAKLPRTSCAMMNSFGFSLAPRRISWQLIRLAAMVSRRRRERLLTSSSTKSLAADAEYDTQFNPNRPSRLHHYRNRQLRRKTATIPATAAGHRDAVRPDGPLCDLLSVLSGCPPPLATIRHVWTNPEFRHAPSTSVPSGPDCKRVIAHSSK